MPALHSLLHCIPALKTYASKAAAAWPHLIHLRLDLRQLLVVDGVLERATLTVVPLVLLQLRPLLLQLRQLLVELPDLQVRGAGPGSEAGCGGDAAASAWVPACSSGGRS